MAIEGGDVQNPNPADGGNKPVDSGQPKPVDQKPADQTPNPGAGKQAGDDPRIKGLTADLVKERKARQDFERRYAEHEARLAERDRQIAALTGAKTPSADEAEAEQIRGQFKKIFPQFARLDDKSIERLLTLVERADHLEAAVDHHWQNYGQTMTTLLFKEAADLAGGELTERQQRGLAAAFIAEAENDPEVRAKYEKGDTAYLKNFAKEFVEDWVKAAERKVTARNVNQNRPVPRSGDRNITTSGGQKIDVKDNKQVEDLLVAGFRERGGVFGRRNGRD